MISAEMLQPITEALTSNVNVILPVSIYSTNSIKICTLDEV